MADRVQDTTQGVQNAPDAQPFAVINLSAADESPAFPKVSVNKTGGYVNFGPKNQFPQDIININSKSPVNAAIIDSVVTYVCGKGVRDSNPTADKYVGVPYVGGTWDSVIERTARDYKNFGGFYSQIIVNKGSTTVSVFHQDYSTVRVGQIDEKGNPLTFKISNDWTKTTGKNKPVELQVWPGMLKAKKGVAYMAYYWNYAPGLLLYSMPDYYAAIDYIRADGTLGQFYNNCIDNGFTPSVVFTMSSNPDQKVKDAFVNAVEKAYSGSKGANKAIFIWGESGDVNSKVTPFNSSNNADLYNNVEGIIFQKIISANRLSSPTLAGVSGSGNLSGNAAEIIDAYVLYNYTVIEKMRRVILDYFNQFTKINGTAPLVIDDLDVLPKIRETESPDDQTTEDTPATLSKKDTALVRALKALLKWK